LIYCGGASMCVADCGDRIANDSLKPLADACVSICEDSDPKVSAQHQREMYYMVGNLEFVAG
jgi:hypothetical protein